VTSLVKVCYFLRCQQCGRIEIENQARPDLALARHTRETHHAITLVGLPVPSEVMGTDEAVHRGGVS